MHKTIKPLLSISALSLFFAFMGVASLTLGYMYASRKPVGPVNVITSDQLQAMMKTGKVAVLNVLSRKTFDNAHIVGSINIPLNNLRTKARQLFDKNQELVVYCASVDCHASRQAAQILNRMGFKNVFAYEGGMRDWYTKKLPTEGPCTMRYLYNGNGSSTKVCKVSRVKSEKRVKSSKKSRKTSIKKSKKGKKKAGATSAVKAKKSRGKMGSKTIKTSKTAKTKKTGISPREKALKKKKQVTQRKKNKRLESLIVTSPEATEKTVKATR